MPRPKTKGEPLVLRLPLSLDDALDRYCQAQGLSRIVGAETILEQHLQGFERGQQLGLLDQEPTEQQTLCIHAHQRPIAGGLRRCEDCGWVRGADGTWRSL